jgi:hypothetical protein
MNECGIESRRIIDMTALFRLLAAAGATVVLGGMIDLRSAEAGDGKTIAANPGCHAFVSPSLDFRGRIFNTSRLLIMQVICPLVRDNPAAKPLRVEVLAIDNTSALTGRRDISCSLSALSRNGNEISTGAEVSTSGTNANGQVLVLPIPATLFDRGTYVVNCTIPNKHVGDPASGIASIYYEEP